MRTALATLLCLLAVAPDAAEIAGDLELPRTWHVFGPLGHQDPVPAAALKSIPEALASGEE